MHCMSMCVYKYTLLHIHKAQDWPRHPSGHNPYGNETFLQDGGHALNKQPLGMCCSLTSEVSSGHRSDLSHHPSGGFVLLFLVTSRLWVSKPWCPKEVVPTGDTGGVLLSIREQVLWGPSTSQCSWH